MTDMLQWLICYNNWYATMSDMLQCLICYNNWYAIITDILQCLICYNAWYATINDMLQCLICYNEWHVLCRLQHRQTFTQCSLRRLRTIRHVVMGYIVMGYIVMGYIVMGYIVMGYLVMTFYSMLTAAPVDTQVNPKITSTNASMCMYTHMSTHMPCRYRCAWLFRC